MIFKDFYPTKTLSPFVQFYRLRHFLIPRHISPPIKPYPPRPEQCMAFYPRGFETTQIASGEISVKPRSVISGQYTYRINRFSSAPEFLMILVVFKPGALHRLTGIPFHELLNRYVDLEDVFPVQAGLVNERLNSCNDYTEMIQIIENFLMALLSNIKTITSPSDQVLHLFVDCRQNHSLDWLASQACLSTRQFERKFDQYIGINPKTFSRIIRFNQSYNIRLKNANQDWLSIALECGYYDYQHLVRDYKEFANATPNLLFKDEHGAPERILGLRH